MITILDRPVVFEGVEGLSTQALGKTGVDELKFKDTIGVVDTFDNGALMCGGEAPPAIMDEVGVDMSPEPSPKLDMTQLKGKTIPGGLNEQTCTSTGSLRSVKSEL